MCGNADVRRSLIQHLPNVVREVFMAQKPPPPAQSRWTGVCDVANCAFGLYSFHNLLRALFTSLRPAAKTKGKKGKGKGKDQTGQEEHAADLDVSYSEVTLSG